MKLSISLLVSLCLLLAFSVVSLGNSGGEEAGSYFDITGRWLELSTELERNRTLGDSQTLQVIFNLLFNDHYHVQTGVSYDQTTGTANALFLELGYERIAGGNFSVMIKFLGNQYAQYNLGNNSIIPYLKWEKGRFHLDLGVNHRFLNTDANRLWNIFHYQTEVHEVRLYYDLGLLVCRIGNYCATLDIANHTPMVAGNTGAFALLFKNRYMPGEKYRFFAELGLYQTGSVALSANYYKTTLRGGVEVKL